MSKVLTKVKDWSHIPQQAFRYFPKGPQIKEGTGSNYIRRIFESGETYEPLEIQLLGELNIALKSAGFKENQWFDEANKLRFIQANKQSISKTVKSIIENCQWRQSTIPIKHNQILNKFLATGTVYICGRDAAYRPILVIDIGKFNLDNAEIQKTEFLAQVLGTTFEFILNEMLIQGQIENYVLLINLNSISALSIGGLLKKLLEFTNNAYRSRLFVSYILNTTTSISFMWRTFKGFLSQNTVRKINFCDGNSAKQLFLHTHPSQVEKKFGGQMPDFTTDFFPFKERSSKYSLDASQKSLISKEQYNQSFKSGKLKNRKVLKSLVQDKKEPEPKSVQQTFIKANQSTQLINNEMTKLKVEKQNILDDFEPLASGFFRSSNKVTGSLIDELPIKNMNSIRTYFQQPKYIGMKKKYYESL